jgi:hypothetical protein
MLQTCGRQALDSACGNSHKDPTQGCVDDSLTASLFVAKSDKPTGEIQQTVMLDLNKINVWEVSS